MEEMDPAESKGQWQDSPDFLFLKLKNPGSPAMGSYDKTICPDSCELLI